MPRINESSSSTARTARNDDADADEDQPLEPRRPEVPAEAGVNRFVWDLTHAGADNHSQGPDRWRQPDQSARWSLPELTPSKLTVDGKAMTGEAEVLMDPRVTEPRGSLTPGNGSESLRLALARPIPRPRSDPASWLKRAAGKCRDQCRGEGTGKIRLAASRRHQQTVGNGGQIRGHSQTTETAGRNSATSRNAKGLLKEAKAMRRKAGFALEARLHNPKAETTYDILAKKGGAKLYSQLSLLLDAVTSARRAANPRNDGSGRGIGQGTGNLRGPIRRPEKGRLWPNQ